MEQPSGQEAWQEVYGEYSMTETQGTGTDESADAGAEPAQRTASNRLAGEVSPYLLQHARNPVNWYPWGPEAFAAASRQDKPVFLSIGFSSCHWCHVMERDCFNDPEVAELMNDACVAVKVDREERPDLDGLFMEVCQIQNGSGGWPLNVLLTPEGRPFFATTWLPKRTTGEMPGLTDILPRVKWLWLMQREDILRAAKELENTVKEALNFPPGHRIGTITAKNAMDELVRDFDGTWGGFGKVPKFPDAPKLLFLLQQAGSALNSQQERDHAFSMVDMTLRRMWRGGIHDHLGGGFSRYSTDERWLVPHFEKLLSDQAMLLLTASIAYEHKPDAFYKLLAEDIVSCIVRDFMDPSQCFRSAIDADTSEGEGRYYLWQDEEIRSLLPEGDAGLFDAAYAVLPGGNFGSEIGGSQIGYNILYEVSTVTELARRYGMRGPEVAQRLANDRRILLEARNRRAAPFCDDKILMDWNGLTIGALARASSAFGRTEWRTMAEKAAFVLQKSLVDPKGKWRRRLRGGSAGIPALPGDYAALLWGIMELYRAAEKAEAGERQLKDWLKYAGTLADALIENFWDEKSGGFFLSAAEEPFIFFRRKSAEDNAVPSANALAAIALDALGLALEEKKYADMARKIIACFARAAAAFPVAHLTMIAAGALWRPVKVKEILPEPVPEDKTDAEAQATGEGTSPAESAAADESPRRAQRSARRERAGAARPERRTARPHRSARSRESRDRN